MHVLRTGLIALALATAVTLSAAAEPVQTPGGPAVATAANAYFAALNAGDASAFGSSISALFRVVLADGTRVGPGDYIGGILARRLDRSTPVQAVRIGTTSVDGTTATETVDVRSWDNVSNGTEVNLERDIATHRLTFTRAANGTWLLDEDHITSAEHYL